MQEKGIKINDKLETDEKRIIKFNDFINSEYLKISHGKKRHYLIKFS